MYKQVMCLSRIVKSQLTLYNDKKTRHEVIHDIVGHDVKRPGMTRGLELAPNHLIDNADVGLDDADDLRGDVLVHVVGDGDAGIAVFDEFHGNIHALQQALGVDAGEDEASFVEGFGALGGGADADGREGVADGGEEAALFGQGAAIGNDAEGVHLQAVVVVEAEGFVLDDAGVELEAGGLQALAGARVATVQNRHVVLLCHLVNRVEEREEVLLRVDVLLTVGAEQDVLPLLQPKSGMNVRCLNLRQVVMQHLCHRGTGHVRALLGEAAVGQVAAGVLGVGHVDIGNDVDNPAIRFLRQAFIFAAVARLHVEDGDVEPLSADDAEAGVRVAQNQHGVGLNLNHQLVRFGDDITHGFAQVSAHGIHVHIRVRQFQVLEEHAVEVVVVVLSCVCQQAIKVRATFIDHGREADDFGAGADDNQQFESAIILKLCHIRFVIIIR